MLRGVFGKKKEKTEEPEEAKLAQPLSNGMVNKSSTGKSESTGGKIKWPWDGAPDHAACNFAVGHLFNNLPVQLKVEGRVHAETCLAAIGAIAGFTAQRALFSHIAQTNDETALQQMRIVTTANGSKYYVGEPLNRMLVPASSAEFNERLWSLAAGGAITAGLEGGELPRVETMFAHVSNSIGGELEGLPSVPKEHHPKLAAKELLTRVWPFAMMCFTGRFPGTSREFGVTSPHFRPAIASYVANALIRKLKPQLDPKTALTIVMESAIYASKLEPAAIKADSQPAKSD